MKRKVALFLCIAIIIAAMLPVAAYARGGYRGGHHGGGRVNESVAPRFALCPIDNCKVYGPHAHDGNWYCNQSGVNWNNYAVCAVEGCTLQGLHQHNGTWYHCVNYPDGGRGGFCGGRARNWR